MPAAVGLDLAKALRADPLAADAVRRAVGERLVDLRQQAFFSRDDHFAAAVVGQSFALAELFHRLFAESAVERSQRAGPVVDARVEHARVAARLMLGDGVLFFEHGDGLAGKPLEKSIGRRQADNSAADDDEVAALH